MATETGSAALYATVDARTRRVGPSRVSRHDRYPPESHDTIGTVVAASGFDEVIEFGYCRRLLSMIPWLAVCALDTETGPLCRATVREP